MQLRRANAVGIHAAIESWFLLRKNSRAAGQVRKKSLLNGESNTLTPMTYITNIGNILADAELSEHGVENDPANELVIVALNWVSENVHKEQDMACKKVYLDTLRIALDGMGNDTKV